MATLRIYLNKHQKKNNNDIFVNYPNTALYSPLPYIPSAMGILIANTLRLNYLQTFYIARVANLVMYLVIGYFILKHVPVHKQLIFAILLLPTGLFLASGITADSIVIAMALTLLSLIICIKHNFNKKVFVLLLIVSFFIGSSKSVYFLLPLSSLILGIKLRNFLPIFVSIFGLLIWTLLLRNLYIPLRIGIDPMIQINFITNKPLDFNIHFL